MNDDYQNCADYDDLMRRYLDTCNKALLHNKNRFPFKQIFDAVKKTGAGKMIEVKIAEYDPTFVVYIADDMIAFDRHDACGSCECDGLWQVEHAFLSEVVQNTQVYVQNPARLNWEWMYL